MGDTGLLDALTRSALAIAGAIHLAPLLGVRGGGALTLLYGLPPSVQADPTTHLMMRHRGVTIGVLGAAMVGAAAAGSARDQALATGAGAASAATFAALAGAGGGGRAALTPQARRVLAADWVALACLAVAGGGLWARK